MIEIRAIANDADYEDVCSLIRRSQKAESEATGVLFNTKGLTPAQLKDEIKGYDGVCFCAFDNSVMAGTLSLFADYKKKWYSREESGKIIKYVAVAPEYQGKGIASKLIDKAKKEAGELVLSVSTGEKNTHAIHLYERNGFILVDVTRGLINNAYKMAYWKSGCPIKANKLNRHIMAARMKCAVKKRLFKPTVTEEMFR